LDPNACNFNPDANFNLSALCCYGPDSCNGLDPQLVCPGVGLDDVIGDASDVRIFPNPVGDLLYIEFPRPAPTAVIAHLVDRTGRLVAQYPIGTGATSRMIDLSHCAPGIYLLRMTGPLGQWNRVIVKS
jgi:hypothetical protein